MMGLVATDLAPGKMRVFANVGVGGLRAGRWNDVYPSVRIQDYTGAGLVSLTGPHGEEPPEQLPRACCGARR